MILRSSSIVDPTFQFLRISFPPSPLFFFCYAEFLCHIQKILKFLCLPQIYATPYYATPNSEMFMPPFFLHPWIFLCLEEKIEIHEGISTFLAHFFSQPSFFYAIHFHATLKKIEIFMPPSKILCHPFYATPGVA